MNHEFEEFNSFACMAFSGRGVNFDEQSIWVTEDLLVSSRVPLTMDVFWETELGGIATREVSDATTIFVAVSAGENYEALKSYLHSFHYGLLLQGTAYNAGGTGWILGGPIRDGKLHLSSIGDMLNFEEPAKVITSAIERKHLDLALRLAEGIDSIYSRQKGEEYLRLRKGFGAFILGLRGDQLYIRLHQFVRAVEAVLKPRRNNLKNDFKQRSKVFAGDNVQSEEILDDLYELRSAAEHLNPMQDKLLRFDEGDRMNMLTTRCYQAELLARFVYTRILSDPTLILSFESDSSVDNLWAAPDLGADNIDLVAAATANYYDFLPPS